MRNPNLNSLRMFDAAARHLTFRAAANELNLTQGAVAQQVRRLEADLGHKLFDRLPRGLALTQTGRRYHTAVSEALGLIDRATAALKPLPRRVTLSVPPSLAAKWLVPRLALLARDHPDIAVQTVASEGLTDFSRDGVDIAIRQGRPPQDPGLATKRLAALTLTAVAAPEIAEQLPSHPDLHDLAALPLIEDGHAHWERLLARSDLLPPTRALRFNQTALAMDAAAAGQGIALAPALVAQDDIAAGRLVALWRAPDDGGFGFHLLTPAATSDTTVTRPETQTVAEWLLAQTGTM